MRFTVVALLAALCAVALANPTPKNKQYLERQKDVLRLFRYVNQPSYFQDFVETAQNFNFYAEPGYYTKPEVAKNYYKIYENGILPRGKIFSPFNEDQLYEAIALYKLFYYAKDYQTFYNTAVWARQNVNEGLYLYALSVAIVHRSDTYGIVLPPIYEIYPNYFFNSEVIQEAYKYKQQYHKQQKHEEGSGFNGYTINANYSGFYLNLNPEQSLSYFTEDIGVNSFYYYFNIYYPFWLGGEDFDYKFERRGELFYYFYQQFLARYYLERLSNGFGEIPFFNYEVPFETGYYPSLRYPNGLEFPTRPNYANLYEYFYNYGQRYGNSRYAHSYTKVQDFERRIRDVIAKGYVFTPQGNKINLTTPEAINVFGNLIDSNPDSPDQRYYGNFQIYARHLLGYSYQAYNRFQIAPSALEQFETSARDPAFYQFYKRIIWYFQKYKHSLPAYTKKDLTFKNVEVTNVQFDRLVTYFDYFYSDLSNAVFVNSEEFGGDKVHIRARQSRLNHKSFTYKINVKSNEDQEAVVRVYIGPKYDEYGRYINISQNRLNFVQFDHFKYELKSGENVIERNSRQAYFYQNDRTGSRDLYQQVASALNGEGEFSVSRSEAYFGMPRRFLLPKGTYGGFEYQFYVFVSPYVPYAGKQKSEEFQYYPRIGSGAQYIDNYPLGYPFDRPIYYEKYFNEIPNSYVYTAKIYHRDVDDINASTARQ